MEVTYRRELNHSYLVIANEDEQLSEKYPYQMMVNNRIGGLLDCRVRQLEGSSFLYYDISSRQPLERIYESVRMKAEDLKHVIDAVQAVQEDLAEFLLDEQGLLLDASLLFADMETEELYFCYRPGNTEDKNGYRDLADFFLEHVDHSEEHAVNIAYQFYKLSKADYFVLSSFLPYLEKEAAAASDSAAPAYSIPVSEPEKEEPVIR